MSTELYLGPIQPTVNPKTKRFQKGHVPYNKGKKMKDIMGEDWCPCILHRQVLLQKGKACWRLSMVL